MRNLANLLLSISRRFQSASKLSSSISLFNPVFQAGYLLLNLLQPLKEKLIKISCIVKSIASGFYGPLVCNQIFNYLYWFRCSSDNNLRITEFSELLCTAYIYWSVACLSLQFYFLLFPVT
jgi:hypothetical protein